MGSSGRKYVLIGGLVVLAIVLAYRLIPMLRSLEIPQEEIELKANKLAKYRQAVQQAQGLDRAYTRLKQDMARLEARLLPGKTSSLGAVYVQNMLKRITDQTGVEIRSIRVLKAQPVKGAPYTRVPVEFRLNCTIGELKQLLYQIMKSPKYLNITRLRIRAYERRRKVENISVTLTVEGIMKKSEE